MYNRIFWRCQWAEFLNILSNLSNYFDIALKKKGSKYFKYNIFIYLP